MIESLALDYLLLKESEREEKDREAFRSRIYNKVDGGSGSWIGNIDKEKKKEAGEGEDLKVMKEEEEEAWVWGETVSSILDLMNLISVRWYLAGIWGMRGLGGR